MLELTSLNKVIDSLGYSLEWYDKGRGGVPDDILRDSVIQRFEYTFELSWKMMKRWLENNLSAEHVDGVSRKELFRIAAEHQLIDDPLAWFKYHEARNQTSHVYNQALAEEIFNVAVDFYKSAAAFYKKIEKRND